VQNETTDGPSPHFSPVGAMIAPSFELYGDFLTEWNTGCLAEGRKFSCDSRDKRGRVDLVRNAG
jgi:hypothetical protein